MKMGRNEDTTEKLAARSGAARVKNYSTAGPRGPKVHTSFRITPVVEVFSKMKGEKEDILKEVGLHGLTELPREDPTSNKSFDWQFAFWLLRQLDSDTGCIDLGVRGRLEMRCEDVELAIGIPCSGVELKKSDPLVIQKTKKLVKQGLLLDTDAELSLENVVKVLERDLTAKPDGGDRRAFVMVAFIFAVSYFLAPKGRPAKVNNEILECILDPVDLKNINWASYVLLSLRDASGKLRRELVASTKSVTLDGCLLLLQIIYLDNMDFGLSSTTHDVIPRIKDFPFEKLRELINADKRKERSSGMPTFGIQELRSEQDTLYTRGDLYRSILFSKQRLSSGVFLESDKEQVLEYVRRNVDEGKRRVMIASRQFEEHANNTLDQCHVNIRTLLDVWLEGRVINVGKTKEADIIKGEVSGRKGKGVDLDGSCGSDKGMRGRYKTMTRRPTKVRKVEAIGAQPGEGLINEEVILCKEIAGGSGETDNLVMD